MWILFGVPGFAQERATLVVAEKILVDTKEPISLAIRFETTAALPPNTFVRVRQLPPGARLTQGYQVSSTTWAVPLDRLAKLQLMVPSSTTGEYVLQIQLVSLDGTIHARKDVKLLAVLKPLSPPKLVSVTQKRESKARRQAADVMAATSNLAVGANATAAANTSSAGSQAGAPPAQPKTSSPAAAAASPSLTEANASRARRFLEKGNGYLLDGNVNTARLFYRRAADIGLAAAAMAMAATFDPKELASMGIIGLPPDVEEARRWYQRAKELGSKQATARLARLGQQ